jgi:hypothetical protein
MLESILEKMSQWKKLGEKTDEACNRRIGHTPIKFPQAYLHTFFAPLPESSWIEYGLSLPEPLRKFYKECNGLHLFASNLSIYGIRTNYVRTSQSTLFQPFDLKDHDREHRSVYHKLAKGIQDSRLFFGSYEWDGSGVYMTQDSDAVFRCLRNEVEPVNEWKNIQMFLESEYSRLEGLFNDKGYLIDEDLCTAPS